VRKTESLKLSSAAAQYFEPVLYSEVEKKTFPGETPPHTSDGAHAPIEVKPSWLNAQELGMQQLTYPVPCAIQIL
jgi:hypothetical protein